MMEQLAIINISSTCPLSQEIVEIWERLPTALKLYSSASEARGTITTAKIKEYLRSMFLERRLLNIGINFAINGVANASVAK